MILDSLICLTALAILATHVWSMRCHFVVDRNQMPKGMNMLSLLAVSSTFFMIFLIFWYPQPFLAQLIAMVLLLFSFLLFWATIRTSSEAGLFLAFDEKLPRSLLQIGPYGYVRHPFYSSYLLLWSGWALATWNILALLPLAMLFCAYWIAARGEERKFASTPMAEEYAVYAARTGRFLPKITVRR